MSMSSKGVHSACVSVPPAIQQAGAEHRSLQLGQRTSLLCSVIEGDEPISLAWFKDGANVTSALGATVNYVGHDSILSINALAEHHIGNYTCRAVNVAGTAAISFYITVNGNSSNSSFSRHQHNKQPLHIQMLLYKKKHHNAPIAQYLFYFRTLFVSLIIFSFGTILFIVAPKIQPFTFLGDLVEGSKGVRQTCFVSEGDPPLLLSWFRDGQDLEADPSVRISRIDQLTSMLAISDLRSRHSGNYSCVAKNDVAAVAETAVLTVKGK